MSEPTAEEVRKEFLDYLRTLVDYWSKPHPRDGEKACDGLVFSITQHIRRLIYGASRDGHRAGTAQG